MVKKGVLVLLCCLFFSCDNYNKRKNENTYNDIEVEYSTYKISDVQIKQKLDDFIDTSKLNNLGSQIVMMYYYDDRYNNDTILSFFNGKSFTCNDMIGISNYREHQIILHSNFNDAFLKQKFLFNENFNECESYIGEPYRDVFIVTYLYENGEFIEKR